MWVDDFQEYISGNKCLTQVWPRLYVGSFFAATQLCKANPREIKFVINCTKDIIEYPAAREISSIVLGFDDGFAIPEDKFWRAMRALHGELWKGNTVLVHCHAGVSRSATIVASYLYLTGAYNTLEEALQFVESKRSCVGPAPAIINSAKKYLLLWPYDGSFSR